MGRSICLVECVYMLKGNIVVGKKILKFFKSKVVINGEGTGGGVSIGGE